MNTRVRIEEGQGKSLKFAAFAASAVSATEIVAAAGNNTRIKVVSYVFTMSASGTAKFTDSVADMSGAFDIVIGGGMAVISQPSSPLMQTGKNLPLYVLSTVGLPKGHVSYFTQEG